MSRIFEALQNTGAAPEEPVMTTDALASTGDLWPASAQQERPPCAKEHDLLSRELVMRDVPDLRGDEVRTVTVRLAASNPLLPFESGATRSAEQYRIIRTKIHQHVSRPQIVVVTSAGPGDGKTVTSVNVAAAMSLKAGARVLLLDGDLRRSSIATLLGLEPQPGLRDVLSGKTDFNSALLRIEQFPNLYVLPAGTGACSPAELLDSPRWTELCTQLRREFTNVIIDSPPVAAVSDYDLIQAVVDGVVMVARPDHTRRAAFKKALGIVSAAKLVGVILNDVEDWFLWDVHGRSNYHYYEPLDMTQMRGSPTAAPAQRNGR